MGSPAAFLPIDRLFSVTSGLHIPRYGTGAALFGDLSGFTPFTERLVRAFGQQHAAELLTDTLNTVFEALIVQVHHFGGTVISFAGDGITCWFDDVRPTQAGVPPAPGALRAAACAQSLHHVMERFTQLQIAEIRVQLGLKAVIAAGPTQRFVVGDPQIQLFDLLIGAPVDRLAEGESLVSRGMIVVDAATRSRIITHGTFTALRHSSGEEFFVLTNLAEVSVSAPWPEVTLLPGSTALQSWLLPTVAERISNKDTFLAELRPATVLFLRFSAVDYGQDSPEVQQLDLYVRQVQQILHQYGGSVHQVIVGDKGCYLYAACGAPITYEDDTVRAIMSALDLRDLRSGAIGTLQIGVAAGRVHAGAYGAQSRRTYGVIGDVVNLAARLMSRAAEGEILIDGNVYAAGGTTFVYEPRQPLPLKGRAEPLPVFAVRGFTRHQATRLREPDYALPLIGRDADLAHITALMEQARAGRGQVVVISGDAGIGKSRLAAEVVRLNHTRNGTGFGGTGQSTGKETPYLAWRPVFQALLSINPDLPLRRQLRWLEDELHDRAPDQIELLPLLGPLLELSIPENPTTAAMEAKVRKGALESLLIALLQSAAHDVGTAGGVLLVLLEDVHWFDMLSQELLLLVVRAAARMPLLILLTTRPITASPWLTEAGEMAHVTILPLHALADDGLEGLVRAKLAQLYPARSPAPSPILLQRLAEVAQGNPFYVEELLNYIHDRGIDPYKLSEIERLDFPDTVYRVVLARIDQLSIQEQVTLRAASVIGRQFRAAWLPGYLPDLGAQDRVYADLERLAHAELTPLIEPEPELLYLFKHIVTQEVAYDSLPRGTRRRLHTQLAHWLEATFTEQPPLDLLAFHYERGNSLAKRREYVRRAADAARQVYANAAAADYYTRLLDLEKTAAGRMYVQMQLAEVQFQRGRLPEAQSLYAQAAETAQAAQDLRVQAEALSRRGRVLLELGEYRQAQHILETALQVAQQSGDPAEELRAARYLGGVAMAEGRADDARRILVESLAQAQQLADREAEMSILINLGFQAVMDGDEQQAESQFQTALILAEARGDRWHTAIILNNFGELAARSGRTDEARTLTRRSLAADRAIGNHVGVAFSLINLADMACSSGNLAEAQTLIYEALALSNLSGGVFTRLCALFVTARLQLLAGASTSAAELLRLCMQHPAGNEDLRAQVGALAATFGIDLVPPAPSLGVALHAAEQWLTSR